MTEEFEKAVLNREIEYLLNVPEPWNLEDHIKMTKACERLEELNERDNILRRR